MMMGHSCLPLKFLFIIIQHQMDSDNNIFFKIAQKVTKLSYFYQILQYQETRLQLKPFKIDKLLPDKAVQTYQRIQNKYETGRDFKVQPEIWHESEKRLFAWFIAFYTYIYRDQAGIKTNLDFQALSPVFFHKSTNFLEFHFLILLRTADKVYWDEEKDQMLLDAINIYGMKWNEVSMNMFMVTNKAVFRSPKNCRERWLNHLDYTKVRGNWTDQEDIVIFEYVTETGGKKWSKLVNVLNDKRTEHTIKNRFNALIAKYRRYKLEKDIKVAERVLKALRKKMGREVEQTPAEKSHQQEKDRPEEAVQEQCQGNSHSMSEDIEESEKLEEQAEKAQKDVPQIDYKVQNVSQSPVEAAINAKQPDLPAQKEDEQQERAEQFQIKQENHSPIPQKPHPILQQRQEMAQQPNPQRDYIGELMYPFQNYSYQMQMYHNYNSQIQEFYKNQIIFYQQLYTLPPMPTADTTRSTRESKLLEERRRKREGKKEP